MVFNVLGQDLTPFSHIKTDPQTGKKWPIKKPDGFDEYWDKKHPTPKKPQTPKTPQTPQAPKNGFGAALPPIENGENLALI